MPMADELEGDEVCSLGGDESDYSEGGGDQRSTGLANRVGSSGGAGDGAARVGQPAHEERVSDLIPGLGFFFLKRDKNSRKRRREFIQLGRSQRAKVIKLAYSVVESICGAFCPGEHMELLDALVTIHKEYRRNNFNDNNKMMGTGQPSLGYEAGLDAAAEMGDRQGPGVFGDACARRMADLERDEALLKEMTQGYPRLAAPSAAGPLMRGPGDGQGSSREGVGATGGPPSSSGLGPSPAISGFAASRLLGLSGIGSLPQQQQQQQQQEQILGALMRQEERLRYLTQLAQLPPTAGVDMGATARSDDLGAASGALDTLSSGADRLLTMEALRRRTPNETLILERMRSAGPPSWPHSSRLTGDGRL